MSHVGTVPDEAEAASLSSLLADLRNEPPTPKDPNVNAAMIRCQKLLDSLQYSDAPTTQSAHWYCSRSPVIAQEAATFLIRIFAYQKREAWLNQLREVLKGCTDCVVGYLKARKRSDETYLSHSEPSKLRAFNEEVDKWELELILQTIKRSASAQDDSLTSAPPSVVYHALANLKLASDERILELFSDHTPKETYASWPSEPPAGLFLCLAMANDSARNWAEKQASQCSVMEKLPKDSSHMTVLRALARRLKANDSTAAAVLPPLPATLQGLTNNTLSAPSLWIAFPSILRLIAHPDNLNLLKNLDGINLVDLVLGHLNDRGSHFRHVLESFVHLLDVYVDALWDGLHEDTPDNKMGAVLDNPAFESLLKKEGSSGLAWLKTYLTSVWKKRSLAESFPKVMAFMCETLQHRQYESKFRAQVISVTAKLLSTLYTLAIDNSESFHLTLLCAKVEPRAKIICAVAFDKEYAKDEWKEARRDVRQFLKIALSSDGRRAHDLVARLTAIRKSGNAAMPADLGRTRFQIHKEVWQLLYNMMPKNDVDALGLLLHVTAASAHLVDLKPDVYAVKVKSSVPKSQELKQVFDDDVRRYNEALKMMRLNFETTISARYDSFKTLLSDGANVTNLMAIMFSPYPSLQNAAQEVVIQACNVDERDQCFKAYFQTNAVASFEGAFKFLSLAKDAAERFLEACSASRSTVLCLTDVMSVLCEKVDGLLYSESFSAGLDLHGTLMQLWSLTADVTAAIFKGTPAWSLYFESQEMVTWMRDAVIFANQMVSIYNVLHDAAAGTLILSLTTASPSKSRGSTSVGQTMIRKLDEVVLETMKWLKLTDVELLHQCVMLVKATLECYRRAGAKPPEACLNRLETYASGEGSKDELSREQRRTIGEAIVSLDQSDTETLPEKKSRSIPAPIFIEDSDSDEVELIEERPAPPKKEQKSDVYQQLLAASRKGSSSSSKVYVEIPSWKPTPPIKPATTGDAARRGMMKVGGKVTSSSSSKPASRPVASGKMAELRGLARAQAKQFNAPAASSSRKPPAPGPSAPPPKVVPPKPAPVASAQRRPPADSESSSSSEDERGNKGLSALGKLQRTPKINKVERRGVVFMDNAVANPAKEKFTAREEARRTQMRLKPDLTPLHDQILSWNYNHSGDMPPGGDRLHFKGVPDSFASHDDYMDVFSPLLLLECWSQLIKSKEEDLEQTTWMVAQKQFVDSYVDLEVAAIDALPPKWYLAETDVVVLRPVAGGPRCILAKVRGYSARPNGTSASLRCRLPPQSLALELHTQWRLAKVLSLSTVHREYAALAGARFYDLIGEIHRPSPAKLPSIPRPKIEAAMKAYSLNEPQATAVLGSLETRGFALIQGPPGTGKTSTICGLVGEFLSRRSSAPVALKPGQFSEKAPPKKILVCAPSNAAIDEVAKRIRDGTRDSSGKLFTPKIVRIGIDSSINVSVKDISLDALVEERMSGAKDSGNLGNEIANTRKELESVNKQRMAVLQEIGTTPVMDPNFDGLDSKLKELNAKRSALNQRLNQARDKQTDNRRALDAATRKCRQEILRDADVICSTLSGSGHESLEEFDFETVVIDEAAQSIELSSLIPLKYRCNRCVLVGDPQQLAPTVLSPIAATYNYQQSLFARIQKHRPEAVHLLSIQYRMHPSISALPSKVFYAGRLLDGDDMDKKTAQIWHNNPLFPPYRFLDVSNGTEETQGSHSLLNRSEAEIAVALYARLAAEYSRNGELNERVGVVTMYRGQMTELRNQFIKRFGRDILSKVDFNTVDGFQGQEKDIIILSCVRAGAGLKTVGFLADVRRMNVAITRSRSSLYVLGHAATLERSDETWAKIVQDARERNCLTANVTRSLFTSNMPTFAPTPISVPSRPKPLKAPLPPSKESLSLMTPQQLKGSIQVPKEQLQEPSTSKPVAISTKRALEEAQDEVRPPPALRRPPSSTLPPNGPQPPARPFGSAAPPVPKTPKDPSASLFMPKRAAKRPAPSSATPGPSNIKKRLADRIELPPRN